MAVCHSRTHVHFWYFRYRSPLLLYWRTQILAYNWWYFSALEPLAFLGMALFAVAMYRKGEKKNILIRLP